ncbi:MAG: serine protein kinase PrkA [Anaeromyxobacter sp.]
MDARKWLSTVGGGVRSAFVENRSILSMEEWLKVFLDDPRRQARGAAQYLRDVFDHYGSEERETPVGRVRRWALFDLPFEAGARAQRVAGQEEVQAAIYRALGGFVRSGRVDRLILLHGPNGSAKSSIVGAILKAMEHYSHEKEGALYRFHWVFPSDRTLKGGGLGFGGGARSGEGDLATFAHLDGDALDARLSCPMKDHPLLLVPKPARRKLLEEACRPSSREGAASPDAQPDFVLAEHLLEGEPCHYCRQIHDALLGAYQGDWLKVMRHVQVERFYVSARYQQAAATVEPQLTVDAGARQVTADRSTAALPPALHALSLVEPNGPLVAGNRGVIEYSDLLKRPLEHFKYLLGASETAKVSLDAFVLQLDLVLIASANEKQLAAFKESHEFASFKGRLELVRVPYLRRASVEQEIYDRQITPAAVGKHVAPHATAVAALWAVLTRLKRPIPERYAGELRALVGELAPLEKLRLYDAGAAPDRLTLAQARLLRSHATDLYRESDVYPAYEGRSGASAREVKTALLHAAQATATRCLTPVAVLEELEALCRDKTVHDFLQQEVVEGYHDHEEFVRVAEARYLDTIDEEIRDSMGLVTEGQYRELFGRYAALVSSWLKGEKVQNRLTGASEPPDEARMTEFEGVVMPPGEDRGAFRRGLVSAIGAFRLDHPDAKEIDYVAIFPDLFRRLREHTYEERKRQIRRTREDVLRYLSDERDRLEDKARRHVEETVRRMRDRYGYCEHCAQDALLFLMRRRYEG